MKKNNENLVEILKQIIRVFETDESDKRKEVAKSALLTLLGIGALKAVDYVIESNSKK